MCILLDNEEEEPMLMVVWVMMSPAIDHDPVERWKTCQMPLSMLNDLWFMTFNTHLKELAEISLLFNNVNTIKFMSKKTRASPENSLTVFYWDRKMDNLVEFEYIHQ
jgi:hypothetical protein